MGTYSTGAFAMYVIFYLALTLLSILWMFSIIARYCRRSNTTTVVVISTNQELSRGLDASVIESFPKFAYTTDTEMDTDMDTDTDVKVTTTTMKMTISECVVCLGVFVSGEMLRVLPKCGHVFHAECIDAWLQSHATCPFCRANLSVGGEVVIDVHHHQER